MNVIYDEFTGRRRPCGVNPHNLRGRNLRYALLTLLEDAHGPRTVTQLIRALRSLGLTVGGENPAKTVGDVLRYEYSLGRVRRVSRGCYVIGERPATTIRRHRDRLRLLVSEAERSRMTG